MPSSNTVFNSLMDGLTFEDKLSKKVQVAQALIAKNPRLADILLDPLLGDSERLIDPKMKDKRDPTKGIFEEPVKLQGQSTEIPKSSEEEFMDEYYADSHPHPFNRRTRIIGHVTVELSPNGGGGIHISDVMTYGDLKQGHATYVMKFLIELADKHNVVLDLSPVPYGLKDPRMKARGVLTDRTKLESWYASLGFKMTSDHIMIYKPNTKLKENFKPSTFMQVGRNLIELQMNWLNEDNKQVSVDVFVNGKSSGHYTFEGSNYCVNEKKYETVEEAIAELMKLNAPRSLPRTNANNILLTGRRF